MNSIQIYEGGFSSTTLVAIGKFICIEGGCVWIVITEPTDDYSGTYIGRIVSFDALKYDCILGEK